MAIPEIKVETAETNESKAEGEGEAVVVFAKMVARDNKQNERLSNERSAKRNMNDGISGSKRGAKEKLTNVRHLVCILSLLCLMFSQMNRTILYQTIVSMTKPLPTDVVKNLPKIEDSSDEILTPTESTQVNIETTQLPTDAETTELPQQIDETTIQTPDVISSSLGLSYQLGEDPIFYGLTEPQLKLDDNKGRDGPKNDTPEAVSSLASDHREETTADAQDPNGDDEYIFFGRVFVKEEKFDWTMKEQLSLLGAFYYSYPLLMILGGRISEIHGAKYVVFLSVGGSAVISLLTPWMANRSYTLLFCSRVLMGAFQSGITPALYALCSKWLNNSEATIYASLGKMMMRLGGMFGSMLPGLLPDWPMVYYITGVSGSLCALLWLVVATSEPTSNHWVNETEIKHIMKRKTVVSKDVEMELSTIQKPGESNSTHNKIIAKKRETKVTPWGRIFTSRAVIALIIAKISFNASVDFVALELPSYLKYVHHANKKEISVINSMLFFLQTSMVVLIGWVAKVLVKKHKDRKTAIRRIFQSITNFGMGLFFIVMTVKSASLFQVGAAACAACLMSMFTAGGEVMLPYDITEEYTATIAAVANSIATTSAIWMTQLSGVILEEHPGSSERWNKLIYLVAGLSIVGGCIFVLLAKADRIDFNADPKKEKLKQEAQDDKEAEPNASPPEVQTVGEENSPVDKSSG